MAYLHDHGIVHRDLKPGNVFSDEGIVKVGDYGLSKFISCSRRSGQTESVGTVHYMAPEIANGRYGKEIDIYALGVILYEMLTGRVPFDGESVGEVLMKHLTATARRLDAGRAVPRRGRPGVGKGSGETIRNRRARCFPPCRLRTWEKATSPSRKGTVPFSRTKTGDSPQPSATSIPVQAEVVDEEPIARAIAYAWGGVAASGRRSTRRQRSFCPSWASSLCFPSRLAIAAGRESGRPLYRLPVRAVGRAGDDRQGPPAGAASCGANRFPLPPFLRQPALRLRANGKAGDGLDRQIAAGADGGTARLALGRRGWPRGNVRGDGPAGRPPRARCPGRRSAPGWP